MDIGMIGLGGWVPTWPSAWCGAVIVWLGTIRALSVYSASMIGVASASIRRPRSRGDSFRLGQPG